MFELIVVIYSSFLFAFRQFVYLFMYFAQFIYYLLYVRIFI